MVVAHRAVVHRAVVHRAVAQRVVAHRVVTHRVVKPKVVAHMGAGRKTFLVPLQESCMAQDPVLLAGGREEDTKDEHVQVDKDNRGQCDEQDKAPSNLPPWRENFNCWFPKKGRRRRE
eukprot:Blabericola_migrator_1__8474@NODE_441_length_8449_cov_49_535552_g346_i0_p11_GENE_NODE_441_length_8449_cov_49_535552_g346_i0NODE_441_length_8449_cov_49_535552_g346_i0_p11_ORF_typecomplete_len118_score15_19HC2/PF07382_11/0_068_NODE_441_length_8449_cov_49_535552_g346_i037964149